MSLGPQRFRAAGWLPGAHAQTIWPLLLKGRLPTYRRERWETPDGDFIDLDRIDGRPESPCVVLFHGLEGSSRSHYARRLMHALAGRGWHGAVAHFRGCAGEPNRLPRAYHSGDSAEIDWIVRRLHGEGHASLFAAGVSLGGNALLKWIGERGTAARSLLAGAAAVSVPYDLAAANRELSRGFNLVYARHFLRTLIPAALAKHRRFPGRFDPERASAARSLRDFDDAVTAPLHGFTGADDYYARSSCGPLLGSIAIPTLLLHAADDPFLPGHLLPHRDTLPPLAQLEVAARGGHVGFVHGLPPGRIDWMPRRILLHFEACRDGEAVMR